jgi:hypothetical protein
MGGRATLATEVPAAILARMLGIHIKVAVAWQQAASGDWTTYAAGVSRRPTRTKRHPIAPTALNGPTVPVV